LAELQRVLIERLHGLGTGGTCTDGPFVETAFNVGSYASSRRGIDVDPMGGAEMAEI
jgi:hypothetical protein